jgi:prepilin-type N-terminal cleavage/methylation domain-containing protein
MPIINTSASRQRGLTLIELMISISLGLFVLSALVYLIASTMNSNTQQLRTTRLNQELRGLMHLVTRDMRRAGGMNYAADAIGFSTNHDLTLTATSGNGIKVTASSSAQFDSWVDTGVIIKAAQYDIGTGTVTNSCLQITSRVSSTQLQGNNVACPNEGTANAFLSTTISANTWIFENPFTTASSVITSVGNDCIIFGYDKDKDNVADTNENFGYRLDTTENALETWQSGTVACNNGTWTNISDEESIQITGFSVTRLTPAGSAVMEYQVQLSGRLKNNTSITRSIQEVVKMRNDPVL